MRLPKKVVVNNIPFSVKRNRKSMGSSFSYGKGEMIIGAKGLADCEVLEGFIHEVAEISAVERGMRSVMCKPSGGGPDFVFTGNHRVFNDVISDVSRVVADLMRLR